VFLEEHHEEVLGCGEDGVALYEDSEGLVGGGQVRRLDCIARHVLQI
jgi:hypothetical protein